MTSATDLRPDVMRHVQHERTWHSVMGRAQAAAPAAFAGHRLLNLVGGRWSDAGMPVVCTGPVDGAPTVTLLKVDRAVAADAVSAAAVAHGEWSRRPYASRQAVVAAAVDALDGVRDDLAMLLVWEIGKTWQAARADVGRCLDGVRWYLEHTEAMLGTDVDGRPFARRALPGPVSNIASWNYPMSVLVHAELVQLLAGNAVIAKSPTQGGAACLTLAHALMAEAGLPVTLLSGDGSALSEVLVRSPQLGAVAFVGGRTTGGAVAGQLVDGRTRHMLEQEGLNAYGIWDFSQWDLLAEHLRRSFEYGKQRCTAYPRYVVQRDLVDRFLATYLPVVAGLRIGHPVLSPDGTDKLPELDFGPVISARKATELRAHVDDAIRHGAVPLFRGSLHAERFLPGQDMSAYLAPVALLAPPGSSRLRHAEPFGPVDTIVVVDTEDELLAAMNASNGALVATLAMDDETRAASLAEHLQAFKVGINRLRSRGDRDEPFGGRGGSWKGAFVGGSHLVHAVTHGPDGEQLYGNFRGYSRHPVV